MFFETPGLSPQPMAAEATEVQLVFTTQMLLLSKKMRKGQAFGATRPSSFSLFPFFNAQTQADINDCE